jgi:hypothetical protein
MWLGADSVEVDGTEPRPNNAAGGLSMHLVMHGSGASMTGSTAPGDVVPSPEFPVAADLQ